MPAPTDELRTAAAKVRSLACSATEAPWTRWRDQEHIPGWDGFLMIGDSAEPTEDNDGDPVAKVYAESDASYIVVMHPGVGMALADWLDATAAALEKHAPAEWHARLEPQALAVARQINGGAQ